MLLPLPQKWNRTLLKFPESGMGYQIVDVRLRDGRIVKNVRIFNSEQMDWPEDRNPINARDIESIYIANSSRDT